MDIQKYHFLICKNFVSIRCQLLLNKISFHRLGYMTIRKRKWPKPDIYLRHLWRLALHIVGIYSDIKKMLWLACSPRSASHLEVKNYFNLWPRKHCLYSEFLWSPFSLIWTEYGDLQSNSPSSVQTGENADQKYSK